MIYIYNCYGGTHSSVLAAAYHLNKLIDNVKPSNHEILSVKLFNKLKTKDMGKLFFHGIDQDGKNVYTLGRGSSKLIVPSIQSVLEMINETGRLDEKIIFSNTSPTVPLSMTLGGLFSRRLKLDFIGVPLLVIGAKQAHDDLIKLVQHTKEQGKAAIRNIEILDNGFCKNRN
ncbi:DUF3189 family protein [Metabacillus idriensis]|uniref:DUF3189 family protein n=1 Tax=Metabacillus idriensis TaxID=324768 RepID=UPI002812A0CA|nr:DUF3189 family protein [Metabacillus idriensis]MDR0140201.1 DUF3189 family protein [Metabacillus idriensis]